MQKLRILVYLLQQQQHLQHRAHCKEIIEMMKQDIRQKTWPGERFIHLKCFRFLLLVVDDAPLLLPSHTCSTILPR